MIGEPLSRESRDRFEGSGFFEQADCVGDDREPVLTAQQGLGLLVELENDLVSPTDDEQGGGGHASQAGARQVGPAAAGDDGSDIRVRFGGGPQRAAAPVLAPK